MATTTTQITFLLFSLILLPLAFQATAAYEPAPAKKVEKKQYVAVEGLVFCQSCERHGSWSLDKAERIDGAKVSVICKDHKKRVSYYKVFETDAHGYFYALLQGFKISNYLVDHPLTSCKVRLVSSPLESCNVLTNVNYGLNGSPLRYDGKRTKGPGYETVVYGSGPLAFRPEHCAPTTTYT